MAVDVMRTIASRGLRIAGSGTRSTRTSLVPCHTSAFMMSSVSRVVENGLPAARLSIGGGRLARFHERLESAQIFTNRLIGFVAEHPRDRRTDFSARRIVLKVHV